MGRPWQSRQEYLTDLALQSAISDPETIRNTRPVVPQQLFPDRFGLVKTVPTIMDVLQASRQYPSYRSWVSGMPVMRSSFEDSSFDGSGRYSMEPLGGGQ